MKKALSLVLMLVAALAFAACGNGNGADTGCLDCACNDDGTCDTGLVCENDVCIEEVDDCCPGQELHITVEGVVKKFNQDPVACDLAALAPLTAMGGDLTDHKAEASSNASGEFLFDCFDVANVSLGLILLADDTGFDGTGGDYFPTVSGIAGWSGNDDKVCEEGATAMVVDSEMNTGLLQLPSMVADDGYVIGMVLEEVEVDGEWVRRPLGGATVAKTGGDPLDIVYYPNADFSDMGAATDEAHGIFVVPVLSSLTPLIGVKTDYAWNATMFKAICIPGAAYFVPVVACRAAGGQDLCPCKADDTCNEGLVCNADTELCEEE